MLLKLLSDTSLKVPEHPCLGGLQVWAARVISAHSIAEQDQASLGSVVNV